MNAVPCGSNNFRHVRPNGIESGPVERPAIARSRYWDVPCIGLIPGGEENVRFPVIIAQIEEFRIDRQAQQSFGAPLNAGKTGFALIQRLYGGQRVAIVVRFVFVNVKIAAGLDAIGAAGTILAPVDAAIFAYTMKPARCRYGMNMITVWHVSSLNSRNPGFQPERYAFL